MSDKINIYDVIDSIPKFKNEILVGTYFKRAVESLGESNFKYTGLNEPIKLSKSIEEIYGISSPMFSKHYQQQISGDGHESNSIDSIYSSSRLALLCFDGVSSEASLKLYLDNEEHIFTRCLFEVRNKAVRYPSNVDVLLISNDEKILVYLESKFIEYIYDASTHDKKCCSQEILGKGYYGLSKFPKFKDSFRDFVNSNGEISLDKEYTHEYKKGVKQIISHFVGVCQGPNESDPNYTTWKNAEKIYLGTILYKFEGSEFFTDYSEIYKSLAECLNNNPDKDKRVKVIDEVLTYQDVFANNENLLTEQTKKFYELGSYSRNS
jgi:hypothetical protein